MRVTDGQTNGITTANTAQNIGKTDKTLITLHKTKNPNPARL